MYMKLTIGLIFICTMFSTKSSPNKKCVNIYLICYAHELLSDDMITTGNSKYRCTHELMQKIHK